MASWYRGEVLCSVRRAIRRDYLGEISYGYGEPEDPIRVTVQRRDASRIERKPEGDRVERVVRVTPRRNVALGARDLLEIEGKTYEVVSLTGENYLRENEVYARLIQDEI